MLLCWHHPVGCWTLREELFGGHAESEKQNTLQKSSVMAKMGYMRPWFHTGLWYWKRLQAGTLHANLHLNSRSTACL